MSPMFAWWLILRRFVTQGFTINMGPTHWVSPWIFVIGGKNGWGLHFVFNVLLKQSTAVMPAFFSVSDKKERRDGEGGILEDRRWGGWVCMRGGVGEMEGLLTCTCLQSLRMHCTIHLLCLYCHGWGQSDQTPIRYLILPPHAHPRVTPPTPFFHVTCWLKERQGNSQASPNGEMSGREPTSKPCCHGDTVWSRIYRLAHSHSGCSVYKRTQVYVHRSNTAFVSFLLFFFFGLKKPHKQ